MMLYLSSALLKETLKQAWINHIQIIGLFPNTSIFKLFWQVYSTPMKIGNQGPKPGPLKN